MTSNKFQDTTSDERCCCTRIGYDEVRSRRRMPRLHYAWFVGNIATCKLPLGGNTRDDYSLCFARVRIITYRPSWIKHTLNSSGSLDSLKSICKSGPRQPQIFPLVSTWANLPVVRELRDARTSVLEMPSVVSH